MQATQSKIIAEQDKKIRIYEHKMRDLIEAYKAQSKEKEALESTVKSLVANKNEQHQSERELPGSATTAADEQCDLARATKQVMTLTSAIATLADEKRKLERTYLEDKRATRTEHEAALATLQRDLEAQSALTAALEDRCTRQAHAVVAADAQLVSLREESERARLRRAETELHEQQAVRAAHEARVAMLEETVATLAAQCNHEGKEEPFPQSRRTSHGECQCGQRSSTRGDQPRTSGHRDTPDILQFDCGLDKTSCISSGTATDIVDKMRLLRAQVEQLDPELDWAALLLAGCESQSPQLGEHEHKTRYGEREHAHLDKPGQESALETAEEGGLTAPGDKEDQHPQDRDEVVAKLRQELEQTRARLGEAREQMASADAVSSRGLQRMRDGLAKSERAHKQELARLQQTCDRTVLDLQAELARHRNRTIALLGEKEAELEALRRGAGGATYGGEGASQHAPPPQSDEELAEGAAGEGEGVLGACPLYQCCELKARMSRELRGLRRTRRQLLGQLHQLRAGAEFLRSDWRAEAAALTARAERAEALNRTASGVNLEYLRNVLLRYMGTADASCRLLMAKAIGKALQFSPEELSSLARPSWAP